MARHSHLIFVDGKTPAAAGHDRVSKHERHAARTSRFGIFPSIENEVCRIFCADHLVGLWPQDKLNGVTTVGFARAVWPCNGGEPPAERDGHLSTEGFEILNFKRVQIHLSSHLARVSSPATRKEAWLTGLKECEFWRSVRRFSGRAIQRRPHSKDTEFVAPLATATLAIRACRHDEQLFSTFLHREAFVLLEESRSVNPGQFLVRMTLFVVKR